MALYDLYECDDNWTGQTLLGSFNYDEKIFKPKDDDIVAAIGEHDLIWNDFEFGSRYFKWVGNARKNDGQVIRLRLYLQGDFKQINK